MSEDNKKSNDAILSNAQSSKENNLEQLISQNKALVERVASRYKTSPMEMEDIIQEGMIGLLAAAKSYDSEKGASFATYAKTCIDNSIQSALKKFSRKKDIPQSSVVQYCEDETPSDSGFDSAEDIYIAQESVSLLTKVFRENLSDFENEVLRLHIIGCSYNEIASRLSKTPKAIDNALQRVRKKLNKIAF